MPAVPVHLYTSSEHYADHLDPIWRALPAELRGRRWQPSRFDAWWADEQLPHPRNRPAGPVLVAGFGDARKLSGRHELIYVEHGAGQGYSADERAATHGSYAGGSGLDAVRLFIAPSKQVADRWRRTYPNTPTVIVGCPKLDAWHAGTRAAAKPNGRRFPLVAVTFHWDCQLVPETSSALAHFRDVLGDLRDAVRAVGGELLGHGHPRAWRQLRPLWQQLGVPATRNLSDVLDQAAVLVADNTSAMYEFASLDRPVVVLNAPWYRRDVQHGLRFWTHVPGLQVDEPADLVPAVLDALARPQLGAGLRHRAVEHVYGYCDGRAAERAAAAIVEVLRAESEGSPPASLDDGSAVRLA